jgi:hypothetical protein
VTPITPAQVASAQARNPLLQQQLGWRLPAAWPQDAALADVALLAADLQAHAGLTVDGQVGPQTAAVLAGGLPAERPAWHLVVRGEAVKVPFPVVTWEQPGGLGFYDLPDGKKRWHVRGTTPVNLFVLHWDGLRTSKQCHQTLLDRGLSVHLMLDWTGVVYQALDLGTVAAWHAGNDNPRSVGVEICNPLRPEWNGPVARQLVQAPVLNGRACPEADAQGRVTDFHAVQRLRAVELARVVSAVFNLPLRLPRAGGHPSKLGPVASPADVSRGLLDKPGAFSGTCGHFHLSPTKSDPGSRSGPP